MRLTVDASVAIKWFIHEAGHETALTVLETDYLVAPHLLAAEAINVAAKKVRRGEISEEIARYVEQSFSSGYPELYQTTNLNATALNLAISLNHDAYDCIYLALSISLGAPLVTADGKFYRKVVERRPELSVHLIDDRTTSLSDSEVAEIIRLRSLIGATQQHLRRVDDDPAVQFNPKSAKSYEIKSDINSPARKRLEKFLDQLPRYKLAEYIMLCWFAVVPGRHASHIDPHFRQETRRRAVNYARYWDQGNKRHRGYVVGLSACFEDGLALVSKTNDA